MPDEIAANHPRENALSLKKEIKDFISSAKKVAFVFMGNELRTDDAIGVNIGNRLSSEFKNLKKTLLIVAYNTPINFVGKIANFKPEKIIFVDAVFGGFEPGTVILAPPETIKNTGANTTHYQEFEDIVSLLKDISSNKFETVVLGIQVANIQFMEETTPVIKKTEKIVFNILKEIINEFEKKNK